MSTQPIELANIPAVLKEGDGFWRSCTGCHELDEGHDTGAYSKILKCHLGNGCHECGGIGAIWDTTDYQAMGDYMARTLDPAQQDAPTDADIIDLARETQSADPGRDGYILPITFARALLARYAPTQDAERERDAERYRAIRDLLESAVAGGLEVNDVRLIYEEPEPGKAVRLYWYPDTPAGFYDIQGATLDDVADAARAQRAGKGDGDGR